MDLVEIAAAAADSADDTHRHADRQSPGRCCRSESVQADDDEATRKAIATRQDHHRAATGR